MFSNREEINYSSVLGELKHSFIIFFYYPGDFPVM